jgi:cyclase
VEGSREMKAISSTSERGGAVFAQGATVVEASQRIDLGPYAGWTEPERIVFNVDRAYRELRGEPYDKPADVAAIFRGMYEVREKLNRSRR